MEIGFPGFSGRSVSEHPRNAMHRNDMENAILSSKLDGGPMGILLVITDTLLRSYWMMRGKEQSDISSLFVNQGSILILVEKYGIKYSLINSINRYSY